MAHSVLEQMPYAYIGDPASIKTPYIAIFVYLLIL